MRVANLVDCLSHRTLRIEELLPQGERPLSIDVDVLNPLATLAVFPGR